LDYTRTHAHTHTRTDTGTHTHTHTHTHAHTYAHANTRKHTHTHTHTQSRKHIRTRKHTHTHTHTQTHTHRNTHTNTQTHTNRQWLGRPAVNRALRPLLDAAARASTDSNNTDASAIGLPPRPPLPPAAAAATAAADAAAEGREVGMGGAPIGVAVVGGKREVEGGGEEGGARGGVLEARLTPQALAHLSWAPLLEDTKKGAREEGTAEGTGAGALQNQGSRFKQQQTQPLDQKEQALQNLEGAAQAYTPQGMCMEQSHTHTTHTYKHSHTYVHAHTLIQ